ncbi:MAG: circadian clock protein KaiC [Gammaproteobacteria bacterium]|nr:circadian clock protein KaiC [Gammaproteobacteria bacterium]
MKTIKTAMSSPNAPPLSKMATGIPGFDDISLGGIIPNRATLVLGGPGSGKTVFSLQTLVNAARERNEPGIFVAFEETARQIIDNTTCFNWGLPALAKKKIFFLEAQLSPDVVQAGEFDLSGMLGMLKAKKEAMGARWIVFDGIDVLLTLLQNPVAEMREIYRIRDWLAQNRMNAIITAKIEDGNRTINYGFMQFMMDCVIRLSRRLEHGVSLHRLQITKYRGSDFVAGEYPVNFGISGMEVGAPEPAEIKHAASTERISIGFERLDTMLGGGLFRGSSTLITGVPGTSKTTLVSKFAEAACRRGERTLFVSFDEGAEPIMRNLASVGIQFRPHVKSGLLRMYSARTESTGAEDHLEKLKMLIREHRPRYLVIDPFSAIAKAGGLAAARAVANRLIYMAKDKGITVMLTAISEGDDPQSEATELQISMVADTWIHLSYIVRSGERNRALTIIKSRGTWHSNQVRELVLSEAGPMLADVYTAGGEVLMGTLRWEKETEVKATKKQRRADVDLKQRELQFAEADIRVRIKALELDLQRQRAELELYSSDDEARTLSSSERENELRRMRSADLTGRAVLTPTNGKPKGANGSGHGVNGKKSRKEARDAS